MQYSRFIFIFLAGFIVMAAAWPAKVGGPTIIIAADNWCPINCAPPERRLGVGIDLAKAIFEPLGYRIDYRVMPWSQALEQVRAGRVDAVIGASRFDDATLVFPQQSVYTITDNFYVQKGNSWRFQGVHTLKARKLGVIADYGYGPAITEYIRNNRQNLQLIQEASGNDALIENIRKLQSRVIDAIVETRPVMEYTIAKMGLEDRIEWAGSSPQAPVYLAFSPALPASRGLAAQFDAGMRKLVASGAIDGFYRAYGLSASDR
ncbi:MAG: transporter substrate-binding domain-containing protein [Alphaproteobacteria bacterium]|nr:transporter substrate-binding domain-containing protein [Alphaproteobacteria bacterium]